MSHRKLITLLGPTASGKSEMAVELALKLGNTVICNCDLTQMYSELIVGSGRIEGVLKDGVLIYRTIQHYGFGITEPDQEFGVLDFVKYWNSVLNKLDENVEWIILTGGTGFYVKAILEGWSAPEYSETLEVVRPWKLRSKYFSQALHSGKLLNHSDLLNPRRLVSYFTPDIHKMGLHTGVVLEREFFISISLFDLVPKIEARTKAKYTEVLWGECIRLFEKYPKVHSKGIEYQCLYYVYLGWISESESMSMINLNTRRYAKRQITWLKKHGGLGVKSVEECLEYL